MAIHPSMRVAGLGGYPFVQLERRVARLRVEGHDPIDFGVGDPSSPVPIEVRQATIEGVERHKRSGYPSYEGEPAFRRAVAAWMNRRFGVSVDSDSQINATAGSKEAVFHVHEAFVDPGDVVISPTPGYPPYSRGALFAEGRNYYYPLGDEAGFLPDPNTIPAEVAEKARIFWICQPHVPTGRAMDEKTLGRVIDFCRSHEILLCSDEAYIDLYFRDPPPSIIQMTTEGVLVFYSLSKRSSMTGYRCGWVAGDPEAISIFRKLKTNIDSGVPRFVQDGAIAALEGEDHVASNRRHYREARDLLVGALVEAGLPDCSPEAGLFIWQKTPQGATGLELAERLLKPDLALITAPGEWLATPGSEDGLNPGRNYIRLALVPPMDRIEEAAKRLGRVRLDPL